MIWKGVTQDNPRGRERVGGRVRDRAPICDIMADTLSVLYGTTENRNDKGPAASGLDTVQFSPICMKSKEVRTRKNVCNAQRL